MNLPLWIFVVPALLAFWSLGAYKRLSRLRLVALSAWQTLLAHWDYVADSLDERLHDWSEPSGSESQLAGLPETTRRWHPLALANRQFMACLSGIKRPVNQLCHPENFAALCAARGVLLQAWDNLAANAEDLGGPAVPPEMQSKWQEFRLVGATKIENYNQELENYLSAYDQFPAWLIARIFNFDRSALVQTAMSQTGSAQR